MDTPPATTTYKNHRFPVESSSHAVWLYFRFFLSFRDVEELLCERGIIVSYETMRKWCASLAKRIQLNCVAAVFGPEISGTWTR
jgi:transposase-like protein